MRPKGRRGETEREVSRGRSSPVDEGPNEKERNSAGPMTNGRHQMPAAAGRSVRQQGEALCGTLSDEPGVPRSEAKGAGSALLQQMLTRENMQRAWKRVRANKGAAGVDGLGPQSS